MPEKMIIERNIVGDENGIFGYLYDLFSDLMKFRSVGYHFIADPREFRYEGRDNCFRIHQAAKLVDDLAAIVDVDGDLGYLPGSIMAPCCLYVDDGILHILRNQVSQK